MSKIRISRLLPFPLLALMAIAYNNCSVQAPSVEDLSFASVGYQHTGLEASCVSCHEARRPIEAASILHGNGADCVACHSTSNELGLAAGQADAIWVGNSRTYAHSTTLSSCVSCHAPNRPAPIAGVKHYDNQDCATCHHPTTANDNNGLTLAQVQTAFRGVYAYTHASNIASCNSCHEKNRPSPTHNPGLDCKLCHTTNDTWTNALSASQIQAIWNLSR